MTDSPRSGSPFDSAEPYPTAYPAHTDPAYAGSHAYGPTYSPTGPPAGAPSTQALPPYWTQTYGQPPPSTPPPEPPPPRRAPRWLWVAAGATMAVVVALAGVLVFTNRSSRNDTVTAPRPTVPERSTTEAPEPFPAPPAGATAAHSPAPNRHHDTWCDPDRRLRGHRARPGDQHHLRGHRPPHADRVQCAAAVAQRSHLAKPGRGLCQPYRHQRRPVEITCAISVGGAQVETRTSAGLTICTAR